MKRLLPLSVDNAWEQELRELRSPPDAWIVSGYHLCNGFLIEIYPHSPCISLDRCFSSSPVWTLATGSCFARPVVFLLNPHHNGIIFYEYVPLLRNGTTLEEYNAYDVNL
jgi:hypothetical protein